jgi:hypothetical protein
MVNEEGFVPCGGTERESTTFTEEGEARLGTRVEETNNKYKK